MTRLRRFGAFPILSDAVVLGVFLVAALGIHDLLGTADAQMMFRLPGLETKIANHPHLHPHHPHQHHHHHHHHHHLQRRQLHDSFGAKPPTFRSVLRRRSAAPMPSDLSEMPQISEQTLLQPVEANAAERFRDSADGGESIEPSAIAPRNVFGPGIANHHAFPSPTVDPVKSSMLNLVKASLLASQQAPVHNLVLLTPTGTEAGAKAMQHPGMPPLQHQNRPPDYDVPPSQQTGFQQALQMAHHQQQENLQQQRLQQLQQQQQQQQQPASNFQQPQMQSMDAPPQGEPPNNKAPSNERNNLLQSFIKSLIEKNNGLGQSPKSSVFNSDALPVPPRLDDPAPCPAPAGKLKDDGTSSDDFGQAEEADEDPLADKYAPRPQHNKHQEGNTNNNNNKGKQSPIVPAAAGAEDQDSDDAGPGSSRHSMKTYKHKLKAMRDEEWERGVEQSPILKNTGFGFKDSVSFKDRGKLGRPYVPVRYTYPPVIPEEEELSTKEWIKLLEREEQVKRERAINAVERLDD